MKKNILFIVFILFCSTEYICQKSILLNNKVDIINLLNSEVKSAYKLLGKPIRIEKGIITTPFCGNSSGRVETFIYDEYNLEIKTRKRISSREVTKQEKQKTKKYYKYCSIFNIKLSSKSKTTINSTNINLITVANIDEILFDFTTKIDSNKFQINTQNGYKIILLFDFKEGKLNELIMYRSYVS
jgi:hypothetical protein